MKKIFYVIFILILSACSSPQVTEETDCCIANVTASVPTETLIPTATEFLYPTQSPEEQAEIYAFETKVAEYPSICNTGGYPYHFSPNGLWREEFCYSESDKTVVLTISNKNTKTLWKMLYRDYLPNNIIVDGGMSISHWSKDGKYAYFSAYMGGDGGGCFLAYKNYHGWGLFRLDLQTGNVITIFPVFDDMSMYYGFSFSPTDRRLVYRRSQENMVILDMKTGETLKVNHNRDFEDEGGYLWSSDGLKFIYSTGTFTNTAEIYSLRLVDVLTGNEKILLESQVTAETNGNCYVAKEWKDNNKILIEQKYYTSQNIIETILEFDLNSNTIISETPITP